MELKIGDKVYPVQPGWAAIRNYCVLHDPPLEFHEAFDHFKGMDFNKVTTGMIYDFGLLLFCFIERGCKKKGIENDLTTEDLIDWIGTDKQINPIIELLFQSYGVDIQKAKEDIADDGSKKKD